SSTSTHNQSHGNNNNKQQLLQQLQLQHLEQTPTLHLLHPHTHPVHPAIIPSTAFHHHNHYHQQQHHKQPPPPPSTLQGPKSTQRELRLLRRRNVETNEHEPRFTHSKYHRTVPENIKTHSSILQVHATDDDLDSNGLIQYSVSDPENFAVDDGGVLYNLRPLDYEHTNGEYLLYVYAEDQGSVRSDRKRSRVPVMLRVENTKEPPWFDNDQYSFAVSESASIDTYVGTVVARDADGDFDRYELQELTPPNTFKVDNQTGIISVGGPDFNDVWEFTFKAVAFDTTGLSSSVSVTVSIIARLTMPKSRKRDENTNKPVFDNCSDISVKENQPAGTGVALVKATDADHGVNGEVSYSLLNDDPTFTIETRDGYGHIFTTRVLDRDGEDRDFFLTVIAKDGAQPASESLQEACNFKVDVLDVNDNAPIFDQKSYIQNLATDHNLELPVLRVTATDPDTDQNAEVVYSIDGPLQNTEYFTIDNHTGYIKLAKPLDPGMADTKIFSFDAVATDKGSPPLHGSAVVQINVIQSGSHPPELMSIFPEAPLIKEDVPENTEVMVVCVDSKVPGKPDLYFNLFLGNTVDTNSYGTFAKRDLPKSDSRCAINQRGVVIFVDSRTLDYETVTSYKLLLQAVNSNQARLNVELNINIQDVNDNSPWMEPNDGTTITENSSPNILIGTIKARDRDISEEFRTLVFSFDNASPDIESKFELRSNGELRTRVALDREEMDTYGYFIPIKVTDGMEGHENTGPFWVTVLDLNDVPPQFDKTGGVYVDQVPEDRLPGWKTGINLKVIDPDIVNHFDFQIVEGNEKNKFRIDSTTGEVRVNSILDYDAPTNDRNFTLLVRLSDGMNEMVQTHITIIVTNVNDLQPVFEKKNYTFTVTENVDCNMVFGFYYTFTVTENVDCNMVFGQVVATDPDLPPNVDQNIRYYLSQPELTNFTIGETTGDLSIVNCLDREAATRGTMTIYPGAVDAGGAGHDADPTSVVLYILDKNDNHPFIQSPDNSYHKFMENAPPATVTPLTIQLDDKDTPEHGCPCTLSFESFTPQDIINKFEVSKVEGDKWQYKLKPKVMLDREAQKFYELPFRTQDREGVEGTRYLTIEVGDVNDSPMTDGSSAIQVYNYQGQFPTMVIGSVYVTDEDDDDVKDKYFTLLPTDGQDQVDTYFTVDYNSGKITMEKGTPEGTYTLKVKVDDRYRNETATGTVAVLVVDLNEEAVMQSGSFRVAGYSAHQVLQKGEGSSSLYDRLKVEIGAIHNINQMNVDIFNLKDAEGGVDIRYNCHGSPYYTAPRLDGLMLQSRTELMDALNIDITLVTLNDCLYESSSPCGTGSCQQFLRPNLTSPLVVAGDTTTMVGVDITPEYNCVCGALEPPPSACYPGFCLNGGECVQQNNTLVCHCGDNPEEYGPRCELKSARFNKGYAWYQAPKVCMNSSLYLSFNTKEQDGILLYSGPTVERPWSDYPKDFLYIVLRKWTLEVYLELGTGTVRMFVKLEQNTQRTYDFIMTWNDQGVTVEVAQCLDSIEPITPPECRQSVPLMGAMNTSHLLNLAGPLQLGGIVTMANLDKLALSYKWTIVPPNVVPFYGCIEELRHNDFLYDLNSTDYDKNTYKPCGAPIPAQVVMGKQSIVIIVVSLLCLILLVLLILCLAHRKQKAVSYNDLDGIVKETIGGSDLEGFGEKDMTQYDLKLLRVGPDGYLFSGEENGRTPGVGVVTAAKQRRQAPLAPMSEDLSIGDFINTNIKKVDKDSSDFDNVRHYCFEGDEMSIASLSSIGSGGSVESDSTFDYKNDWGQRFEKLNDIYRRDSDEEDDSDFEFPSVPRQRKRASLPPRVKETRSPTSSPAHSPSAMGDLGPGAGPDLDTFDPSSQITRGSQRGQPAPVTKVEDKESWC
ncbi:hypothetical protein Pmani_001640, partial [Petrolisthes manimaculis]